MKAESGGLSTGGGARLTGARGHDHFPSVGEVQLESSCLLTAPLPLCPAGSVASGHSGLEQVLGETAVLLANMVQVFSGLAEMAPLECSRPTVLGTRELRRTEPA